MVNNNYTNSVCPSCPSACPSIFAELARVKNQVEHGGLPRDPIFGEICLIIAEVNILNPQGEIRVAGADIPLSVVQEVYRELRSEHLLRVVSSFTRIAMFVSNKKAYLRTALYNSVFELSSGLANDLAQDGYRYKF